MDPWIEGLLVSGYAASPTFKAIVDRVQRSDVIVHVEPRMADRAGVAGMLRFVGHAGSVRYLRVTIVIPSARHAAIALLGHELEHASEVAADASVVDRDSFELLYLRIGDGPCRGTTGARRYDTKAAREATRQILAELHGSRAGI